MMSLGEYYNITKTILETLRVFVIHDNIIIYYENNHVPMLAANDNLGKKYLLTVSNHSPYFKCFFFDNLVCQYK